MKSNLNRAKPAHADARAAWQEQLSKQANPELAHALCQRESELLPRFDYYYQRLQTLPRRWRRGVQRSLRLSLAGVGLALALGQRPALAATINVDGAACNLIDAIHAANTDIATGGCPAGSGADTLVLPANSTITLGTVDNTTFYSGPGLPVVSSLITIEGNGTTIKRSSADGTPLFRILVVSATGDLTLNDATISGSGSQFSYSADGGIVNDGSLTITNSTISENDGNNGGGIHNRGSLTITDSTISSNGTGDYGNGGGILNDGSMTITNSTISNNGGGRGRGGGIYNVGPATITNSTISGNFCGRYSSGGGIFNGSSLTITDSTISENHTDYGGGVDNRGEMVIANSTISENSAELGGGVNNRGEMVIANSTISGNSGYVFGGGINDEHGSLAISNSTVSGNYSTYPGGGIVIFNGGLLTLSRTIISGNRNYLHDRFPYGADIFEDGGSVTADDYNLIGDSSKTNAEAFEHFTPSATDITATSDGTHPTALGNILNTTLANNGGPTETHALVAGSPAIDANPTDAGCPPADQRGVPRPVDGDGDGIARCDIGAVEFTASAFEPQILSLGDSNGDGSQDIAALVQDSAAGTVKAYVKDAENGASIKTVAFDGAFTPTHFASLPDTNGNGAPELVVVGKKPTTGLVRAEIRDSLSGQLLNEIFYNSDFIPKQLSIVPDLNGNGADELALLVKYVSKNKLKAVVKDSMTDAWLGTFGFDVTFEPKDMLVLPDQNGNGGPELGVLAVKDAAARADKIETRDLLSGALISNTWINKKFDPKEMTLLSDRNGNGFPELGILMTGSVKAEVRDSKTGKIIKNVWYDKNYRPIKMVAVPDIDGGGAEELAVLGRFESKNRLRATLKDSETADVVSNVGFNKDSTAHDFAVIDDINGNTASELVMLGTRDGKLRADIKDAETGKFIRSIKIP